MDKNNFIITSDDQCVRWCIRDIEGKKKKYGPGEGDNISKKNFKIKVREFTRKKLRYSLRLKSLIYEKNCVLLIKELLHIRITINTATCRVLCLQ